jgi:hypothetical protein
MLTDGLERDIFACVGGSSVRLRCSGTNILPQYLLEAIATYSIMSSAANATLAVLSIAIYIIRNNNTLDPNPL